MAGTKQQKKETPLMRQFGEIKAEHPDAILLFRVGDFYETFGEDAIVASKILGITLTKRANGSASHIELAGFPHHSLDTYLPKLVKAGKRVAVCDQLEDPKLTKKIVKRGVTELVTPGVALSDQVLSSSENNYLAAIHIGKKSHGLAFLDASTGEFLVTQGNSDHVQGFLKMYQPAEVLFQKGYQATCSSLFGEFQCFQEIDDWVFTESFAQESLAEHFDTVNLKGFGIQNLKSAQIAAAATLHYLKLAKHPNLRHILGISKLDTSEKLMMDSFTINSLELIHAQSYDGHSLLDVVDFTQTAMGARLLRSDLLRPSKKLSFITSRHEAVEALLKATSELDQLIPLLKAIPDLERLCAKIVTGKVNPRELLSLKEALKSLPEIKGLLSKPGAGLLDELADGINELASLRERLEHQLNEDAPVLLNKGNVMAPGVNPQLDEYRELARSGGKLLNEMLEREIEMTSIPSLRISKNNVFGYYFEVRNAHKDKVPENWIRKQTLVNAERYITEELKDYETRILKAEDHIASLESQLYQELVQKVIPEIVDIQGNAKILAQVDLLVSFSELARERNYVKPIMNSGKTVSIEDGRHPVIEAFLPENEHYIPNGIKLDDQEVQVAIITGPNMAGKSALLRQTALIVILAQIGSFVPASSAELGITDKVFSRVGATDNLSTGESTFMVEMNETAAILNNLSDRSLILLDEIGRGTSTFDGISLAWSITEYLHDYPHGKPKVLFATHYHELNEMEKQFDRIKNFNVSIKEHGNKIIFLRKLEEGGTEHSFGLHVARMAGVPAPVLIRAQQVLAELEGSRQKDRKGMSPKKAAEFQLNLFQSDSPIMIKIRELLDLTDVNTMTPLDALFKLSQMKDLLSGEDEK